MTNCVMCGKSRSELEMRPLVNVAELKAGNIIGECKEEGEREIGGGQVNVVCRYCWLDLLGTKTKDEIIEIFETICGLLFEIDRRYKEEKKQPEPATIEWGSGNQYTIPNQGIIWKTTPGDTTITVTGTSSDQVYTSSTNDLTFDTTNISLSSGTLHNLGDQWEELTDDSSADAADTDEE